MAWLHEPTGYVYDDDGIIVNPNNGTAVGDFGTYGIMVPDGTLGLAYFLVQIGGQGPVGSTFTLESYDITTFAPVSTLTIPDVVGTPVKLIRWGANGLAFITYKGTSSPPTGAAYIVSGSFVTGSSKHGFRPQENVRRTWAGHGTSGIGRSTKETWFSPR